MADADGSASSYTRGLARVAGAPWLSPQGLPPPLTSFSRLYARSMITTRMLFHLSKLHAPSVREHLIAPLATIEPLFRPRCDRLPRQTLSISPDIVPWAHRT